MFASPEERVRDVKRRYSAQFLSLPEVSGFGIARNEAGQYVLTIHLNTEDLNIRRQLPDQIEGYRVKVIQSGPFQGLTKRKITPPRRG